MDSLEEFECYDHLLFEPLEQLGWSVEEVSWRNRQVDWSQFEVVVIRSPWDYQQDPGAFMDVLEEIEQSSAALENSLDLVKWNIDKTYLRDLKKQGIEIVPSLWREHFNAQEWPDFYEELQSEEIIIKPTVSANADDTYRIKRSESDHSSDKLSSIFADRPFMVQPFMDKIITEGEFSVFFFGDTYSHTILKTPKAKDFRVQEEHGGTLKTVEPGEDLLRSAYKLLEVITPRPLYSRMDYVRTENDSFALMELELIEPSLYFNMDPKSPQRFAKVFDEWMDNY
jgi:glutathione synthase/RimK-type ligase-like ATP-grasp enzyme